MRYPLVPAVLALLTLITGTSAFAQTTQPADYAVKVPSDPPAIDWIKVIRTHIKPLSRPRGERLPLILWENVPFTVQTPEVYKDELARGFVPHIQLDEKMIPVGKAIQDASGPVIMMQGGGGTFPYDRAGAPELWAHQIPKDFKGSKQIHPCIGVYAGWAVEANEIRRILTAYKTAGVTVNAVWMDWEGEPLGLDEVSYEQAKVCPRCRATLPPGVLDSFDNYHQYGSKLGLDLLGAYLAAPVSEIFPACSTTNWAIVQSTPQNPLQRWTNYKSGFRAPSIFTVTNPVAYGNTIFFDETKDEDSPTGRICKNIFDPKAPRPDRETIDQIYMNILLRHVSGDHANTSESMPWYRSVPWVARWCPDDENPIVPIMSRERYREALRHIWMRGAIGMQVFAPTRPGYSAIVISELEDAGSVYDESLAWTDFILHGQCMNLQIPGQQDTGVIWSGLRLDDTAVVRTFKQGDGTDSVEITPWPDHPKLKVKLAADTKGKTYMLKRNGEKVDVSE